MQYGDAYINPITADEARLWSGSTAVGYVDGPGHALINATIGDQVTNAGGLHGNDPYVANGVHVSWQLSSPASLSSLGQVEFQFGTDAGVGAHLHQQSPRSRAGIRGSAAQRDGRHRRHAEAEAEAVTREASTTNHKAPSPRRGPFVCVW